MLKVRYWKFICLSLMYLKMPVKIHYEFAVTFPESLRMLAIDYPVQVWMIK